MPTMTITLDYDEGETDVVLAEAADAAIRARHTDNRPLHYQRVAHGRTSEGVSWWKADHRFERLADWHTEIEPEPTTQDPIYGHDPDEVHPAFGVIQINRTSGGDQALFDSDVRHQHYITLSIKRAIRNRGLHQDWIHGDSRTLVEVKMSLAQWAEAITNLNSSGMPVTISAVDNRPQGDLPFRSALSLSADELREAGKKGMAKVVETYQAVEEKATKGNVRALGTAIEQLPGNMAFAAESLTEHAEKVSAKIKADLEAYVHAEARRVGLDPVAMTEAAVESMMGPQEIEGGYSEAQHFMAPSSGTGEAWAQRLYEPDWMREQEISLDIARKPEDRKVLPCGCWRSDVDYNGEHSPSCAHGLYNVLTPVHAADRAMKIHKDDVDKSGQPYWKHLEAVALGTQALGGSISAIQAAWLHDSVEDHPEKISLVEIESEFGEEVAGLVEAVTHRPDEPYSDYIDRVIEAGRDAVKIKVADLRHNTDPERMADLHEKTRERLLKKYEPSLARLLDFLEGEGE